MDQLMQLGHNLGSGLFKPEDYFAQLQSMNDSNNHNQSIDDDQGLMQQVSVHKDRNYELRRSALLCA